MPSAAPGTPLSLATLSTPNIIRQYSGQGGGSSSASLLALVQDLVFGTLVPAALLLFLPSSTAHVIDTFLDFSCETGHDADSVMYLLEQDVPMEA